jgi:hypothetical protein
VQFGQNESDIVGVPAGITPGSTYEYDFNTMTISQQQSVITLMKSDGVTWLRLDVNSSFSNDTLIKDAEAAGIHVDTTLQASDDATATASEMSSLGTQAVTIVKPLGVSTYEIINEPNCNGLSAATYRTLLQLLRQLTLHLLC